MLLRRFFHKKKMKKKSFGMSRKRSLNFGKFSGKLFLFLFFFFESHFLRETTKNIKFGGSVRGSKKHPKSGQKPTPHLRRNGDPPIYIVFKMPPPHTAISSHPPARKKVKNFFSLCLRHQRNASKKIFFFYFFFYKKIIKNFFFFR